MITLSVIVRPCETGTAEILVPASSDHMPRGAGSTAELLAIAHAMEMEAARRYGELAARMRLRSDGRLAELFSFLSGIERKHAGRIDEQSLQMTGHSPDAAQIRWDLPENFDEEEASSRLLTPYLALAIAVRNEERAFAFYCYVAAEAARDDIRVLAEELAKDELTHATLLRRERRKAYRDEGRSGRQSDRAAMPGSVHELLAYAADLESAASRHHGALAEKLASQDEDASRSFARAAADEAETATLLSQRLGSAPIGRPIAVPPTIEDGLRILEETFEFYADVAEKANDEEIVREAQALAERAVRRLSLTHGSLRQVVFDEC